MLERTTELPTDTHAITHAQEQWYVIIIALLVGLIGLAIAKSKGIFQLRYSHPPVPIRGKDVIGGFSLFILIEMFIAPIIVGGVLLANGQEIDESSLSSSQKGWVNLFVILSGFLAICISNLTLPATNREALWNQSNNSFLYQYKIGVLSWFVAYPLVLAVGEIVAIGVSFITSHTPIEQNVVQQLRANMTDNRLFIALGIVIITLVPMTEEYLFRGLLQNWLKQRWKSRLWAIGVSSLIFTLFHYSASHGASNIELLVSLFFLSCTLGFLYERQHSLWASIGLHSFFNLMTLLFIYGFPEK